MVRGRRARRWEAANGPAKAHRSPGPLVGANSREAAMEVMEVDAEQSPPRGRCSRRPPRRRRPLGRRRPRRPRLRDRRRCSRPPRADAPEPSADSRRATSGCGQRRRRVGDDSDCAQRGAAPPRRLLLQPKPPRPRAAMDRDRGRHVRADPTMTLCTKEACGGYHVPVLRRFGER